MKTVVVTKPFEYEIVETDMPAIKNRNDVLVKMKAAGVCGSDIHIFKGENPCSTYPRILGHENVGIVEAVGEGVVNVEVGDHVVIDLIITCGECFQCKTGRENVCEQVKVRGSSTDGGFREYLVVPDDDVYKIAKNLPFEKAVLIEPFCIGAHSCKRGRVSDIDIVFVFGVGTIGSVILQTCKSLGAEVIACDLGEENLNRAAGYGADYILNGKTEDVIECVRKITDQKGVSVAFDAACFKGSLEFLLKDGLLRNAGRIVSLGFTRESEAISQAAIDRRELEIIGSRMSCYQFEKIAKMFEENKFNLNGLITDYIKFSEIDKVFYNIVNPNPKVKKMAVIFD
jgi:L-gulonate 5-dehydrogenase